MKKLKFSLILMTSLGVSYSALADKSMPYEGANCPNRLTIEQSVFQARFDVIHSKMKQIRILSRKIQTLRATRLVSQVQSEIEKLDKNIEKLLEDIFQLELKIESDKEKLYSSLSLEEKDLINIDNSFVMSEDCQTMYVLPPKTGNATLTAAQFTGGASLCQSYDAYTDEINYLDKEIDSFKQRISEATTAQDRQVLRHEVIQLFDMKEDFAERKGSYGNKTAFTSNILFQSRWNDLVKAYDSKNRDIKVVKMSITDSKMRALSKSQNILDDVDEYNGVSYFAVPGLDMSSVEGRTVFFNGSKSGLLQLNLHSVCPMKEALGGDYNFAGKTISEINNAIASVTNSSFAADVEFSYPVIVKSGYKVLVNEENFKKAHKEISKLKNTTTAKTIYDELFKDEKNSIVKVEVYNQGLDDDIDDEYVLELVEKIKERIYKDYLREVATPVAGTLKVISETTNPAVVSLPDKNWRTVTRHKRVCRKVKKKAFGITYSSRNRCWNQAYNIKEYFTVRNTVDTNFIASFSTRVENEYQNSKALTRKATMSFIRKGE